MKSIKLFAVLGLLCVALVGCFPMVDPARLPTREELSGTWLAFSRAGGYRLDLLSDGRAELAVTYAYGKGTVLRYSAARWELDDYDFSAKFLSDDSSSEPIYLRAVALEDSLQDVTISSSSSGNGSVSLDFVRESQAREVMKQLMDGH